MSAHRGHPVRVKDAHSDPCFRSGGVARVVAWLMLGVAVVAAVLSILSQGPAGIGAVVLCGGLAALALTVIRIEVRATPTHLVIHSGWRRRAIPWSDVEGFRVERTQGQRRVLALVRSDLVVRLPVANGGVLLTSRRQLVVICDALDSYRLQHS